MARHIDISLDGLHQLLYRIERKELTDGDWAIYAALVLQLIAREQGKQDRMAAKLKGASSLASGAVVEGQLAQTEAAPAALPAGQPASGPAADEGGSTKKKVKGHGRNGAQAFVNAKHFAHGLPAEVLGTCCPACELGRLSRYREKVVIRVVGQPLFSPELHHPPGGGPNPLPPPPPMGQPAARDCGTGQDDPGCSMSRAGGMAMEKAEFEGFITALRANLSESARGTMVRDTLRTRYLTARQLGAVMDLFIGENNRLDAARNAMPHVIDWNNAVQFAAKFISSSRQREYNQLVSQQR